jgi:thymidylate synthase ThyX
MTISVKGKSGISATILADSISPQGSRLTTYELEYPRFILSELNTHRMGSKNSASSRAIPIAKMHEHIKANTAMPVHWGKNQPGMSAKEEVDDPTKNGAIGVWEAARDVAIAHAKVLSDMGIHKQIANRTTEPYMMMKTVFSGTEFANLFWLRNHEDAQPEFHELASCMDSALKLSTPTILVPGQWHLPYITSVGDKIHGLKYFVGDEEVDLETAKQVSASCCAQVSYRRLDDSIEKAKDIFNRLINSTPVHASPVEHQATPMHHPNTKTYLGEWEDGVTHMRRDGSLWSGNFKGWIQYRQLIPNNTQW